MRYDLPTEKLGASSPMRAPEVHAPDVKDYASEQMKATGDALMKGGTLMAIIAENHENDIAEATTRQRINRIETGIQNLLLNPETGYMAKLGESAVKDMKPTLKAVDDLDKEIAGECKTDLEKGLYARHAPKYFKTAKEHILTHSIGQAKVWNTTEAKTGVGNAQREYIEVASTFKDKPVVSGPKPFEPVGLTSPNLSNQQKAVLQQAKEKGLGGVAYAETGHIKDADKQYSALGIETKHGKAYGRYQIMQKYWGDYAEKAGLPRDTKPTPENQDYVAAANWLRLLDKYGGNIKLAAAAWNTGEPNADKIAAGDSRPLYYLNDKKNPNSTVANYIAKVEKGIGAEEQTPIQAAREKTESRIRDMFRAAGGTDTNSEAFKNLRESVWSDTHAGAVVKLLESDNTASLAQEYYDKYRGEMSVERRKEIQPKLNHYAGDAYAKKIWADQAGSININTGPNLEVMYKSIDGNSALDRDAKDIAKARINQLKGQYAAEKSAREENVTQQIFGMINSKKAYPDVLKFVKETGNIDEHSRKGLLDVVASAYGQEPEGKFEMKLQYQGELLKFQEDYSSGKYGHLEPKDVIKMAPKLGSYTDNAMQFVYHANSIAGNVKVSMDDLKNRLRILKKNPAYENINIPDPDSSDASVKGDYALLQSKVMQIMASTAKAGQPLSVDAAIDRYLQMVVHEKQTIPLVGWDSKTSLYKIGTKGYSNVASMSADTKAKLVETAYMERYGVKPTPQVFNNLLRELEKSRK